MPGDCLPTQHFFKSFKELIESATADKSFFVALSLLSCNFARLAR